MRDMRLGPACGIELLYAARQPPEDAGQPMQAGGVGTSQILHQQCQELRHITFFQDQAAVHIKLAQFQIGVEEELAFRPAVLEADHDLRLASTELLIAAVRVMNSQGTMPEEIGK